jgi:hypothetical protein
VNRAGQVLRLLSGSGSLAQIAILNLMARYCPSIFNLVIVEIAKDGDLE